MSRTGSRRRRKLSHTIPENISLFRMPGVIDLASSERRFEGTMVLQPADENGKGKVLCFMRGTMAVLADRERVVEQTRKGAL